MSEIEAIGISQIGRVRTDNQDAIHLPTFHPSAARGSLYAVADGMGGYAHGGLASALALDKFSEALYTEQSGSPLKAMRRGIDLANLAVHQKAQQLNAGQMGTTLTAVMLSGSRLYLAHVGDSRAYLIRGRRATLLTNDHTTVNELVRMRVLAPDKVRTHAQRSVLTKALGLGLFVQPDLAEHRLHEGDQLVLCSDGVWSVIQDHEFAELAAQAQDMRELGQSLIDLALERQTDDNVSAITVNIRALLPGTEKEESRRGLLAPLRNLFSKRQDPILYSNNPVPD